ncbi:Acetyltransferase ataH [Exophiala dermatitidis]
MALNVFIPSVTTAALITASLICFTSRHSLWRPAAVPFVVLMAYYACKSLDFFDNNQLFNPMQAGFIMAFAIHYTVLLAIIRLDDKDIRREIARATNQAEGDISWRQRFTWTLYILTSLRGVDTSYEIKGLERPKSPSSKSRIRFLAKNLLIVVAEYLVLDFFTSQPTPDDVKERLFGEGREFLIFRPKHLPPPTFEEVMVHLMIALMCWGPMGRPDQWPAMFGSIFETYSLRRFWGRSWQQLFRWCFQSIGEFLCTGILRLPPRSIVARYVSTIAIFTISAFLHAGMDAKSGIGLDKTGTIVCFLLQPLGIILEDTAQALFQRLWGKSPKPKAWHKLVGYIWVWTFLTLVAPIYNIPLFRYQDPAKARVPFPVIQRLQDFLAVSKA